MGEAILTGSGLRKVFNGTVAVDDASFAIEEKTITAIIGPNGAGKTTLFNLITGFLSLDRGTIRVRNELLNETAPYQIARRGISRTFQDLRLIRQMSVRDNLRLAYPKQKREAFWHALFGRESEDEGRVADLTLRLRGFGSVVPLNDEPAGNLSYGQQKLLTLMCCLAAQSDILLLDEPVAGVHPDMAGQILFHLAELKENGSTVVFIEHDIEAVKRVAEQVIVMDHGKIIASGATEAVLGRKEIIEAYLT
jgi:ABC-type branched-subunit amino acid transport system ATPase component